MKKGKDYIVIPELPIEQQEPFLIWMGGQSAPVIEEEGENKYECARKYDYDKWFEAWSEGREAPVTD